LREIRHFQYQMQGTIESWLRKREQKQIEKDVARMERSQEMENDRKDEVKEDVGSHSDGEEAVEV